MSFSIIIKIVFFSFFLLFLNSCSSNAILDKINNNEFYPLTSNEYDVGNIAINNDYNKTFNYTEKIILKNIKNTNPFLNNIIVKADKIYVFYKNVIYQFDKNNGEILSKKTFEINQNIEDQVVSFHLIGDSFIVAYKSGLVFRVNLKGDLIWLYNSKKIINSPLNFFDEQIIILNADKISSISFESGIKIWSHFFEDIPIYQAKGGQLKNFFNILYFILPNNKVGSIDYNFGTIHHSKFNEISFISSINNSRDQIYVYKNFIIYLDEGKYLYTFDIFNNEFIVFKKNIDYAKSNLFINDALILKNGEYIQAINILNGMTYWLIKDDRINKKSSITFARNLNSHLEIILNNGDLLKIKNKKLFETDNLNVGKINKITFENQNIIISNESGKTIIF
tara:strand:- start:21479 stop:22660 length:1182 start_codon:yes stop_codon:yes gene_type:complete